MGDGEDLPNIDKHACSPQDGVITQKRQIQALHSRENLT
jgi:hypothetical protein